MKKLFTFLLFILVGTVAVQSQGRKYNVYAVGFYNLENLFDTCHDEGKSDYE